MLKPSSPLPFVNGRPSGSTGYGTSPSTSPGSSSAIFSSLLSTSDTPDAVIEKHRLSTSRREFGFLRRLAGHFSPYPLALPFTHRRLMLPLPNFLYPNSPTLLIPPNYRSNHPRHQSHAHRRSIDKRSLRLMLIYGLILTTAVLLAFSKIRSAIRRSTRHIPLPFQDPSTLVLTEQEIRRIWEWEISHGHYPSSRRTPTMLGLHQVPNPSLPLNSQQQPTPVSDSTNLMSNFDDHVAVPPIRTLQQNQLRAPPSFLDDVVPVGPMRSYLNITTPKPFHPNPSSTASPPGPYPPRPISNGIIDLDVIMDYCDFSTNQYVRDCLEILRMGGGLDLEKRVRRGDTRRWRHIYHEQNDDGTMRTTNRPGESNTDPATHVMIDEESGEQLIKDPSYRPVDILDMLKSEEYVSKLKKLQDQMHSADSRRRAAAKHPSHPTSDPTCDSDYPKIFHIFWAGPFTDKPYLALSSFLFTQNLGLHLPLAPKKSTNQLSQEEEAGYMKRSKFLATTCRPQMWVWINPGPAASIPNPNARRDMFDNLRENPWSAPFLHDRFREVIKFKMWNTTEQLDGVPEVRDHWRELPLFNSGGVKYGSAPVAPVPEKSKGKHDDKAHRTNGKEPVKIGIVVPEEQAKLVDKDGDGHGEAPDVVEEELGRFGNHTRGEAAVAEDMTVGPVGATGSETKTAATTAATMAPSPSASKKSDDELFERVGSTSSKGYDRLSVVLSDMARFVLCHRFGGIYLDADTILLRDWEELWGWRGQFAYRWSRHEKYNTAVLRLHRHSAIGSFLFKTALANGLDFHPMTISRYTKDAYLDGLLLRLPDALFDSAWLNTEYYQRDRPAFPYFKRFEDFFDPPKETDAGPAAIGFDGFFRGAFSYHFHNFWWIPFDPSRNWPDLGPRFANGERIARVKILAAKMSTVKYQQQQQQKQQAEATSLDGGTARAAPIKSREQIEAELMHSLRLDNDDVGDDERDLGWATVLKRTFEAYLRCERPNMYGEWLDWADPTT
ncbi:hypothetical protein CROQUDRAFT_653824 [Cronartium quercuum f. sp. fusiforme G11]|uniref:Glycosyltransferase family 32 protein n=1 Tax=Cronartium quercuum f. sp. fusiforme G11 TaxID=708437 RepID=A0A9P6NS68_9BASI|nr:hypothetical protein CROQUDRAFT_653824 [Cronartium quercuum f. sp. fusiforme G11]